MKNVGLIIQFHYFPIVLGAVLFDFVFIGSTIALSSVWLVRKCGVKVIQIHTQVHIYIWLSLMQDAIGPSMLNLLGVLWWCTSIWRNY
jgi:hypothetical protein